MKKLLFQFLNPGEYGWLASTGLLLIRIQSGLLMAVNHGWGKYGKLTAGTEVKFLEFMGLSAKASLGLTVFAEFLCGLLLFVGLGTRFALVPLIITMGVALLHVHLADPFKDWEGALSYLLPYLAIMILGPGKISLDFLLFGKNKSKLY